MQKSDSERWESFLEKKGYKKTQKIEEADFILVNMCSVRQSAVDRVYGLVPKFKKLKQKKKNLKIALTGCILEKDKRKFQEIFDYILKKEDLFKYPLKLNSKIAFIPISNGCNNFCAYCVVPFTRGPLKCRSHKEIIKEVKEAIKKGCKEIWLLGQNVNDYTSPCDPSIKFPELLKMVNDIPGKFKIRFTSPHPKNFSDKLIKVIKEGEKIEKYINLPVQSGDDEILKKMGRNYTVKEYKNLIKKLKKAIPDIKISTDVIVGFPGETKKHFQNTVKLFKWAKFDSAYIAKYSPRPGTRAFKMKDDVSWEEKKQRERILREIIEKNKKGLAKASP